MLHSDAEESLGSLRSNILCSSKHSWEVSNVVKVSNKQNSEEVEEEGGAVATKLCKGLSDKHRYASEGQHFESTNGGGGVSVLDQLDYFTENRALDSHGSQEIDTTTC